MLLVRLICEGSAEQLHVKVCVGGGGVNLLSMEFLELGIRTGHLCCLLLSQLLHLCLQGSQLLLQSLRDNMYLDKISK